MKITMLEDLLNDIHKDNEEKRKAKALAEGNEFRAAPNYPEEIITWLEKAGINKGKIMDDSVDIANAEVLLKNFETAQPLPTDINANQANYLMKYLSNTSTSGPSKGIIDLISKMSDISDTRYTVLLNHAQDPHLRDGAGNLPNCIKTMKVKGLNLTTGKGNQNLDTLLRIPGIKDFDFNAILKTVTPLSQNRFALLVKHAESGAINKDNYKAVNNCLNILQKANLPLVRNQNLDNLLAKSLRINAVNSILSKLEASGGLTQSRFAVVMANIENLPLDSDNKPETSKALGDAIGKVKEAGLELTGNRFSKSDNLSKLMKTGDKITEVNKILNIVENSNLTEELFNFLTNKEFVDSLTADKADRIGKFIKTMQDNEVFNTADLIKLQDSINIDTITNLLGEAKNEKAPKDTKKHFDIFVNSLDKINPVNETYLKSCIKKLKESKIDLLNSFPFRGEDNLQKLVASENIQQVARVLAKIDLTQDRFDVIIRNTDKLDAARTPNVIEFIGYRKLSQLPLTQDNNLQNFMQLTDAQQKNINKIFSSLKKVGSDPQNYKYVMDNRETILAHPERIAAYCHMIETNSEKYKPPYFQRLSNAPLPIDVLFKAQFQPAELAKKGIEGSSKNAEIDTNMGNDLLKTINDNINKLTRNINNVSKNSADEFLAAAKFIDKAIVTINKEVEKLQTNLTNIQGGIDAANILLKKANLEVGKLTAPEVKAVAIETMRAAEATLAVATDDFNQIITETEKLEAQLKSLEDKRDEFNSKSEQLKTGEAKAKEVEAIEAREREAEGKSKPIIKFANRILTHLTVAGLKNHLASMNPDFEFANRNNTDRDKALKKINNLISEVERLQKLFNDESASLKKALADANDLTPDTRASKQALESVHNASQRINDLENKLKKSFDMKSLNTSKQKIQADIARMKVAAYDKSPAGISARKAVEELTGPRAAALAKIQAKKDKAEHPEGKSNLRENSAEAKSETAATAGAKDVKTEVKTSESLKVPQPAKVELERADKMPVSKNLPFTQPAAKIPGEASISKVRKGELAVLKEQIKELKQNDKKSKDDLQTPSNSQGPNG